MGPNIASGEKERTMNGTIEHATLTAPDISCGHCVVTITEAVGALDGVDDVKANAETKRVDVAFDPGRISVSRIEAALAEAGYPVAR